MDLRHAQRRTEILTMTTPPSFYGAYAVLTGDLVGSSRLSHSDLDHLRYRLDRAAGLLHDWQPGLVVGHPQFFRGDAWQMAITDPKLFLRVSIFLRAALIAEEPYGDTRIAVGLGSVDHLEQGRISQSVGEAFTLSGHALDEMGRRRDIDLSVSPEWADQISWLSPMLSLCSVVIGRWTPKQAQMAMVLLQPEAPNQSRIAEMHGRTQQGISKIVVTAGLPAILSAIEFVEKGPWEALLTGQHPRLWAS